MNKLEVGIFEKTIYIYSRVQKIRDLNQTGLEVGNLPCSVFPAGNYMFKVNSRNIRARCEKCSKLTIKTPDTTNFTQQSTENCSFWTKVADAAMMNQDDKR